MLPTLYAAEAGKWAQYPLSKCKVTKNKSFRA